MPLAKKPDAYKSINSSSVIIKQEHTKQEHTKTKLKSNNFLAIPPQPHQLSLEPHL